MGDVFRDLGRPELEEAAQLGVSELVTNALLHGQPPITVQVRGVAEHPRVEVSDASPKPPHSAEGLTTDEDDLSTVGRGLSLVSLSAAAWGIEIADDGKVVWFEPSSSATLLAEPVDAHVVDVRREASESLPPASELLTVRLLDMPVRVFADFRRHYRQLSRELRLLALAHRDDYPVAVAFTDVVDQVERERLQVVGIDRLDDAIATGRDKVDLVYLVPASAPVTMSRMLDLAELADAFCRSQRLLTLSSNRQQAELRRWYLGEFVRQGEGRPARPWPGSFDVEQPAQAS